MRLRSGRQPTTRKQRTRLALAALGITALLQVACSTKDISSLDIPWSLGDRAAPEKPSAPTKPNTPAKPSATVKQRAPAANDDISADCDELPELTADELRGPPYDVSLQKNTRPPTEPLPRFTTLPDVALTAEAADKLDTIDDAYFKRTGKHIVITSGTRDAARQAKAMYKMIRLGADILRLYKNREAAREIQKAYDDNKKKPADDAILAMYEVLKRQIDRGVFISAHLRAGAADVRSRTMSPSEKKAFVKSVASAGGAKLLEESKPPHFHLQLD